MADEVSIPTLGTEIDALSFRISCYTYAAQEGIAFNEFSSSNSTDIKFQCSYIQNSLQCQFSIRYFIGFIIQVNDQHNNHESWDQDMEGNRDLMLAQLEKLNSHRLVEIPSLEMEKQQNSISESTSGAVNDRRLILEAQSSGEIKDDELDGYLSSDLTEYDYTDEDDTREVVMTRGVRKRRKDPLPSSRPFGRRYKLAGSDYEYESTKEAVSRSTGRPKTKVSKKYASSSSTNYEALGIGNAWSIKEEVKKLMASRPLPLPSISLDHYTSSPNQYRIYASASARQHGFTLVKTNASFVPDNEKCRSYYLFCGNANKGCKYRLRIQIIQAGTKKGSWKCGEVIEGHNHPLSSFATVVASNENDPCNEESSEEENLGTMNGNKRAVVNNIYQKSSKKPQLTSVTSNTKLASIIYPFKRSNSPEFFVEIPNSPYSQRSSKKRVLSSGAFSASPLLRSNFSSSQNFSTSLNRNGVNSLDISLQSTAHTSSHLHQSTSTSSTDKSFQLFESSQRDMALVSRVVQPTDQFRSNFIHQRAHIVPKSYDNFKGTLKLFLYNLSPTLSNYVEEIFASGINSETKLIDLLGMNQSSLDEWYDFLGGKVEAGDELPQKTISKLHRLLLRDQIENVRLSIHSRERN